MKNNIVKYTVFFFLNIVLYTFNAFSYFVYFNRVAHVGFLTTLEITFKRK